MGEEPPHGERRVVGQPRLQHAVAEERASGGASGRRHVCQQQSGVGVRAAQPLDQRRRSACLAERDGGTRDSTGRARYRPYRSRRARDSRDRAAAHRSRSGGTATWYKAATEAAHRSHRTRGAAQFRAVPTIRVSVRRRCTQARAHGRRDYAADEDRSNERDNVGSERRGESRVPVEPMTVPRARRRPRARANDAAARADARIGHSQRQEPLRGVRRRSQGAGRGADVANISTGAARCVGPQLLKRDVP